ncbi:MAG: ferritin-like domain-containing protein [Chloroflexi bacterium]|nr:ferritin-like domain-containing protein [Chloroflexota bacterium]
MPDTSPLSTIDLEALGLDRGAHLLVDRALAVLPVGGRLLVRGRAPALGIHLAVWARARGHGIEDLPAADGETRATLVRGGADVARWFGAERAGDPSPSGVSDRPDPTWGFAARGALVEAGGKSLPLDLDEKRWVWTDLAPQLYAQAAASQWDPNTAIDWGAAEPLPREIEAAVVQVMTYLVENEQAALVVPARFLGRIHPHFREAMQFLATQVADEARHVEVFTRRALLHGGPLGASGVGGRASLGTLLEEPDFALASFLLSVLGEGTFLNLLAFIERFAPDAVTRNVARLVRQDEARHVAFGLGHLEYQVTQDPELRDRLRAAIVRRHDALASTAGLSEDVFDALVILAAGGWNPEAIASGYRAVERLQVDMHDGRQRRLVRLGFSSADAAELSALHTRNFM